MWHIVIINKDSNTDKENYEAELIKWIEQTKDHKHAEAYKENLEGIKKDLSNPSKFTQFLKVEDKFGAGHIVCKASITKSGVDLSEIVKHPISSNNDPMWALMSWAAHESGKERNVTLTAAYGVLVSVYVTYGFVTDNPSHMTTYAKEKVQNDKSLGATTINAAMTMKPETKQEITNKYKKDDFWRLGH